jgi:ferredoxin-type protein NapG
VTEKLKRREFLSLNWESAIGFLGNFIAPQIEVERNFFRPPGACNELEFLASCSRCGKCKEVCPEQSIRLFSLESGVKLVNTPYLEPNVTPCTLCTKCIEVCPTQSLNFSAFSASPRIGSVKVNSNYCLATKNVMCDYCVRACPNEGALELIQGAPSVSAEKCTGCGLCVTSCIADSKALKVFMLQERL